MSLVSSYLEINLQHFFSLRPAYLSFLLTTTCRKMARWWMLTKVVSEVKHFSDIGIACNNIIVILEFSGLVVKG